MWCWPSSPSDSSSWRETSSPWAASTPTSPSELGRVVGLAAGFLAWVSYNLLQIGLWGLFGVMAQGMFAMVFGIDVQWWILAVIGAVLVFGLAAVGVDVGAKVLGVLLVLETALLVVLAVAILSQRAGQAGVRHVRAGEHLHAEHVRHPRVRLRRVHGLRIDGAVPQRDPEPRPLHPAGDVHRRGVPGDLLHRDLWLVIQAFGDSEVQGVIAQDPAAFFFTAMGAYVGEWGVSVMFVLIVSSIFAAQLAFHNAINRYSFALSRDGILPAFFHRTNRMGAPWVAGLIQSVVAIAVVIAFGVAGLDPLTQLVILVNSPGVYGIITLQLLASISVVIFIVRNRQLARRWYVLPAAIFSVVAMAVLLAVLVVTIDYLTAAGPAINAVILAVVPGSDRRWGTRFPPCAQARGVRADRRRGPGAGPRRDGASGDPRKRRRPRAARWCGRHDGFRRRDGGRGRGPGDPRRRRGGHRQPQRASSRTSVREHE